MRTPFLVVLLWLLLAPSVQASGQRTYLATVTSVVDGDTVWVRPSWGADAIEIRIQGIDAPESCQAWGPQAREALRQRILRQSVTVQERSRDAYGRHLARLDRDGQDVGAWLVFNGLAWSGRWRGRGGPYEALQDQAAAAHRGLWSEPAAVEPRRFRKQNGPCPHPSR